MFPSLSYAKFKVTFTVPPPVPVSDAYWFCALTA
jgi:hypothetical protein